MALDVRPIGFVLPVPIGRNGSAPTRAAILSQPRQGNRYAVLAAEPDPRPRHAERICRGMDTPRNRHAAPCGHGQSGGTVPPPGQVGESAGPDT